MKFAGRIAPAVILAALALPLLAQENTDKPRPEKKGAPRERSTQPQTQHSQPQQQEQPQSQPQPQPRREVQQQTRPENTYRPPQPQQQQQPQQQPRQRQDTPSQVYQPRNNPQPQQPQPQQPQPQQNNHPGRTFGNPPGRPVDSGNQPGRTFGNPPGRPMDNRPAMTNTRPMNTPPRTFTTRTGDVIHRDEGGQVRQVRMNNGTTVYRPAYASRRVEVVGSGGRVVVASAPGRGYVQRPVVIQNTTVIKRTYIYNGVPQARIYRPYVYHGVSLAIYTPVRYYHPVFYSYVYNPWPRPIVYSWGWTARPWYGYYGWYFTPYPRYDSPAFWLTDFMIAAMLESAYEERQAARAYAASQSYASAPVYPDDQGAPLSPEVKQAIANEVRRQIDRERMDGQNYNNNSYGNNDNSVFSDNQPHVFVVGTPLTVESSMGECSVREGDVLQMAGPPRGNSPTADLVVLASRGRDCSKGSTVSVGLADLQEMQNHMRATLDRGMNDLQSQQGQNGLPPLPQGAAGTVDTVYAREARPDNDTAQQVADASREGDRAEQQAVTQSDSAPPVLSLGMSLEEVRAIQGEPQKIVDLGTRKIYVYSDLKITFADGKVTDIQ